MYLFSKKEVLEKQPHGDWALTTPEETLKIFRTSIHGLSEKEAGLRLKAYGRNVVKLKTKSVLLHNLFQQLKNPIVAILLFAGIFIYVIDQKIDAYIIFVTLLINLIIGFLQENKVSTAFELLQSSDEEKTVVYRDNKESEISTTLVVPGDMVAVKAGMKVPADIRLLAENAIEVNESLLTGEWTPVEKKVSTLLSTKPITEQFNMLWKGSTVVSGIGRGVVVATGSNSTSGKLAQELQEKNTKTPLQIQVESLARLIMGLVAVSVITISTIAFLKGIEFVDIILTAVAISIAGIPSGLPAAITVVLVVGMQSVLKHGGLVKNLLATETLGSTTWILTDKTGTITKGSMSFSKIIFFDRTEYVEQNELSPEGEEVILNTYLTTNGNRLEQIDEQGEEGMVYTGTPIEKSFAERAFALYPNISREHREEYLPFGAENKYSASVVSSPLGELAYYAVGAPEVLLKHAKQVFEKGIARPLTEKKRKKLLALLQSETKSGKRVLAIVASSNPNRRQRTVEEGYQDSDDDLKHLHIENQNITFLAFLSIEDIIREDVEDSVRVIKNAHISVTMVTGDNKNTALHVAKAVGIVGPDDPEEALTGSMLSEMSDDEIYEKLQSIKVFARMSPDQKSRLLRLLTKKGEVTAMTGDGVNDAPALHLASIGVAVSSGTDVAKEAADLILLKNSFSTITKTIIEGRKIISNLKKIVLYLLSTSFSEAILVAGGLLLAGSLPITPVQILWANIIEEAFVAFAFAFEKGDPDTLKRDPKDVSTNSIISPNIKKTIVVLALVTGLFLILMYTLIITFTNLSQGQVQTIMFFLVSIDSIFLSLSLKRLNRSLFKTNLLDNRWLLIAIGISVSLLGLAFFNETLANLLSLEEIPAEAFFLVGVSGFFHITIIEIVKKISFERDYTPKYVKNKITIA